MTSEPGIKMTALVGVTVLIIVAVGSGLVARLPGETAARMTSVRSDQSPAYLHFEVDDWR
jgi:hypothetical protein